MNKLLHMNSFFTKIILAVLSFAVIICVFVPYTKIPAITSKQDVDVTNKTIEKNIGKEQETFNLIATFSAAGSPIFNLYSDEALTQTVNMAAIPLPEKTNVYYFATYAYGYDVNNGGKELTSVHLSTYTVTLTKDTKNNSPVLLTRNNIKKTIDIRVPNATTFDFSRVIDSRKAWAKYDNEGFLPIKTRDESVEVTSLPIKQGESLAYYVAITLKSEQDPSALEGAEPSPIYYALDGYTLYINRDDTRRTLPTVGEIGGGFMSELESKEAGEFKIYNGDAGIFIFMILAAMSTLLAFVVPSKFKVVELILSAILGIGLIVTPILDMGFYTANKFEIEAGWYILIALGALIILAGVFDFIRCTDEYRKEQIRLYGEDVFKKKKTPKAQKVNEEA